MTVTIPDELLGAEVTESAVRRELAVALFAQDRLTLGQAAALAGIGQLDLQRILGARKIPLLRRRRVGAGLGIRATDAARVIVLSDTSPVLNLAIVDRLEPLPELFGRVLIPPAVAAELRGYGVGLTFDWIEVAGPKDTSAVARLSSSLHAGESEAIVLAAERQAEVLLIDERRAGKAAANLGVQCLGLLGVLAAAKRAGLIATCRDALNQLQAEAGFWVSDSLRRRFLSSLGEDV